MKQIIKYQAHDGMEFPTEQECYAYETYVAMAEEVDRILPKKELNDTEFIQHSLDQVRQFTAFFAKLIERKHGSKYCKMFMENPQGYIGRYLDDSGDRIASKLFYRLQAIDNKGREWNQPYFANKANQKAVA